MKKTTNILTIVLLLFFLLSTISAQSVKIGPRLTGNFNIYNQDRSSVNWNGIGIGIGGTVDISFSKTLGIIANLTMFDMKNISAKATINNGATTREISHSLAYLSIDPLFKAEFSGFYLLGGPSFAIKINSSSEQTDAPINGGNPTVRNYSLTTNAIKFDLAAGTGYNFALTPNLFLGADFMVYIPITNTFDFPSTSNSTLSLKLGTSLKFRI